MLTAEKFEDLRRLFREDLKAMENGTYVAPLPSPNLIEDCARGPLYGIAVQYSPGFPTGLPAFVNGFFAD